jgi:hypothetical protein
MYLILASCPASTRHLHRYYHNHPAYPIRGRNALAPPTATRWRTRRDEDCCLLDQTAWRKESTGKGKKKEKQSRRRRGHCHSHTGPFHMPFCRPPSLSPLYPIPQPSPSPHHAFAHQKNASFPPRCSAKAATSPIIKSITSHPQQQHHQY